MDYSQYGVSRLIKARRIWRQIQMVKEAVGVGDGKRSEVRREPQHKHVSR